MSSSIWDLAEHEYSTKSPFDLAENQFKKSQPQQGIIDVRDIARTGARAVETIAGTAGDIQDLLHTAVTKGVEFFTGKELSKEKQEELKKTRRFSSTEELRKFGKEKTGGYLEPQTEGEKLSDEYTTTVASLIGPMKFRKALGIAALGVGAKEGLKAYDVGETGQELGKFGTMLATSMINPNGVKKFWGDMYKKAEKLAPAGTLVSSKPLEFKVHNLIQKLEKGIQAPTEKAVLDDAKKVLEKIKNGKVDVNEMMSTVRSINERMGDPELLKRGKNLYPELKKAVSESIKLYPDAEFQKSWTAANQAYSGFQQSRKASDFIQRHAGKAINSSLLGLFVEGSVAPHAVIPTIGAAVAGAGGLKAYELMRRINSNPTLQKYYQGVVREAVKQNAPAMTRELKKLNSEIED